MPEPQRCHICREPFKAVSGPELSYEAIDHFRLMHPDLHEWIKQMADLHLAWQFQQLTPEDFG